MKIRRIVQLVALLITITILSAPQVLERALPTSAAQSAALSQHFHGVGTASTVMNQNTTDRMGSLPLAVDGSRSAEAIPDKVAYRHFISATAVPTSPTSADEGRRNAMLKEVGL